MSFALFSVDSVKFSFLKLILRPGSVVVDYRISWKNPNHKMSADEMMTKVQSFLGKNNHQLLSRYLVNESTIRTARVPDRCKSEDKNSCDYGCEFSAEKVDFTCTCPDDMTYDEDFKECVNEDDSIYDASREPATEPESEPEPIDGHENKHEPHHHHHHHDHQEHHEHHFEDSSSENSFDFHVIEFAKLTDIFACFRARAD